MIRELTFLNFSRPHRHVVPKSSETNSIKPHTPAIKLRYCGIVSCRYNRGVKDARVLTFWYDLLSSNSNEFIIIPFLLYSVILP